MYCCNCGARLRGDEAFCPVCGAPVPNLDDDGSTAGSAAQQNGAAQQNDTAGGQNAQYGQYNQCAAGGQNAQYGQYNQGAAGGQYTQYGRQAYGNRSTYYPTPMYANQGGPADQNSSYFDGSGIECFALSLAVYTLGVMTCGIAMPWLLCALYKWKMQHTVINGRRLTFTGTGGGLFGRWILWLFLSIITFGICGFFMHVAIRKWEMAHTFIDGEPIYEGTQVSYFDGSGVDFLGYGLLAALICVVTLFIALPWVYCMIERWDVEHQCINGHRLAFTGTGGGLFGQYIIIALLTIITCGIYSSWGEVRFLRYKTENTSFVS